MSPWVWVANILGWPVIHLTVSWVFTRLSAKHFDPQSYVFRPRSWEAGGAVYLRFLKVKSWKARLPDGAAWFAGGFSKKRIRTRAPEYLEDFARETCRGEAAHWATFAFAPIFAFWNPPWAIAVMFGYAVLANFPCIVVQRYNRVALLRIRHTRSSPEAF